MIRPIQNRMFYPLSSVQSAARLAPYTPSPYRERPDRQPFFEPSSQLTKQLRRAAEGVADWLIASKEANRTLQQLTNPMESAMRQRSATSSDPSAVTGQAAAGTKLQEVTVKVDALAQAQVNKSYALAKEGSSVISPGTHTLQLTIGGQTRDISATVGASDTNAAALGKLRDAVNGAKLGVSAQVVEDREAGTVRLELRAEETGTKQAFTVADRTGSAALATGIGTVAKAASDAVYRVNGGPQQTSQRNQVTAAAGIELQLRETTSAAVTVNVGYDANAVVKQVKDAVEKVNQLDNAYGQHAAYLNPVLRRELNNAMSSGAAERLGIAKKGGKWQVDETQLRSALTKQPDIAARELASPGGWASDVRRTLDRFELLPAEALLSSAARGMTAYASHAGSAQAYWQAPMQGWFLNAKF